MQAFISTGAVERSCRLSSLQRVRVVFSVCAALAVGGSTAGAADVYWTNSTPVADFNSAGSWAGGVVPTAADNAHFTNDLTQTIQWTAGATNANALFNNTFNHPKYLDVGSQVYVLTNGLILGQNVGERGWFYLTNGTVQVTNPDGTATLVDGQAGSGSLWIQGGTLTVDQLFATNTAAVSSFNMKYGTLTVLHGSTIVTPGANSYSMGDTAGQTMTWNIGGGTNVIWTSGVAGTQVGLGGTAIVNIYGPDTVWSNTADLRVGRTTIGQLTITNGASARNVNGIVGDFGIGTVTVGTNSVWINSGTLTIGGGSPGNQLIITNGGQVIVSGASGSTIGANGSAPSNTVIVTGTGSLWTNATTLVIGSNGSYNQLKADDNGKVVVGSDLKLGAGSIGANNQMIVTNGGQVVNTGVGWIGVSTGGNSVLVTGAGSTWSNNNGTLYVGYAGGNNQFNVLDGGQAYAAGTIYMGYGANSTNNRITVSGQGAQLTATSIQIDAIGDNNQVVITNGGTMNVSGAMRVGQAQGKFGSLVVTGDGSALNANSLFVGTNSTTKGYGNVLIRNGGLVETSQIEDGFDGSGTITNSGGIFQFITATPFITVHTPGSIVLTNGTISYRGLASAPFGTVGGISYQGNNSYRLNNATNAGGLTTYTFDSIAHTGNPTNYQRLVLQNGARWRSGSLVVGTNGAVAGTAADVVEIQNNFTIQRTANASAEFDLAASTVAFTGGTAHTNAVTGQDFGHDGTLGYPDGFTAANFSYGRLTLGSASDQVQFLSGDGSSLSNALYVNWLDLAGLTNSFAGVADMVTNLLFSTPDVNVYYASSVLQPNNAYLLNQVYQLGDGGGGIGGLLLPAIPEPSALAILFGLGGLLMLRGRRSR